MDPQTAQGAYGYNTWTQAKPGGIAVMPETNIGVSGDVPGAVLPKLSLGHQNPLFWVLILILLFTGYLYGGFNIGVKNIGKFNLKGGR